MSKGVRLTAGKLLTALVCGALLCSLFVAFSSYAAPNPTINYQGKLTNTSGVAVPNGTYNMRFYLYDNTATGATSTAIWSEKLIGADKVQVTNGLFSVMLGSTTPFTGVDFNQTLYLGVEIGGSTTPAWDGEMSPRKVLGTVPAAFVAYDALDSAALGGVASSSFLRSDQADTASGLLSFTGGFISSASSTINSLTFGTATGTTLVINGDTITDFTGLGLVMDGTSLKVATDTLNIAISDTTGTLTVARGGTGSTTPSGFLFGDGAGALDSVYSISSSYIEDVFLRNNADDTTTGKLTIGGGLLSLASSTIGDGTPGGGLTINGNGTSTGTFVAPTYMTTGGVALGAGWTRESIWNNSIGALSGTYGLTTDQTNFRELTAPNVFESASTWEISATTLQNGSVLIAYRDSGNGGFGTFAIYDPAGNEVKAPTVFEGAETYDIAATTLQNGNVLMAYRDVGNGGFGTFAIYDPSGNEVKAPTVFESASTYEISATTLQNGNVLMAYRDTGNSNFGTFAIYDPSGNEVKAPTVFESASTWEISATTLQNGSVLIAYRDSGNSNFGTFAIYDPAGNEVKAPTVFEGAETYDIAATTLQNGSVLMAYRDSGNGGFGTFAIYDPSGNEVKAPTVFESASTWEISATTLQNGNVLMAYRDTGNSNFGTFAIYDPAGNVVKVPTVFESASTWEISATTLQNGNVLIAYRDFGNSNFGTFAIWGSAGAEFTDRLAVTTDTEQAYDLFAINGSSSSSTINATQLGTGDIFNFANSGGEVLTLTNTGYLGLGTTSPLARLTVGSSTLDKLSVGELYRSQFIAGQLEVDGTAYFDSEIVVAGSATSTFEGPVTTGALTASSTITAPTYMTTGGVALGAGWTREGIWNNSIGALSGTYGLTTDQTNFREVIAPTVFESAGTDYISATTLQNGNVLMAYRDTGNSNFGTFAIYDPAGNEVKAPTVFESASTWEISATTLQNGSVLIAYRDSGNSSFGTFAIYDPAGNEVKAPTVFESAGTDYISATTLQNGNVLMAYRDVGNGGFGTFAIYDPSGNEVKAPTVFESASTWEISATTLQNGNVALAYRDNGNSDFGTFAIYDPAGNEVKAPTVFESASTYEISATTLQNGNVLIAYNGNSSFGTFAIYDPAGNVVKAPTVFESAITSNISATTLQNGNVLIAYRDVGNSSFGTFAIYDPAGNEVKAPTVFESASTWEISATTLQNGNVALAYRDNGNSNFGTFAIWGSAGAEFTDRLAVTTETEQAYDLFAINGSSSSSTINATQLGTGDIFNFANSGGEVLTLTNTGYLGLGTTSPLARLTVGSSTLDKLSVGELYRSQFIAGQLEVDGTAYFDSEIVVAGSATSTFEGPVTTGALTASSTITAPTYMTTGGVALGAGWTREGIWNNSIGALSGTYGLTTDQTNFREVIAPTVFESAGTDYISATTLQNGSVLIAYRDSGNSSFGTFAIYDPAGNEVKAPTVFESASTWEISATTLQNGSVLMAYRDVGNGGFGTFAIYDPAGNEVKAPTVFENASTYEISATTLQNGNVLMAYRDVGNGGFGTFAIYDPAGNEVKAPTVFENASTYEISATTLQNGNVLMAYRDTGNSNFGTFAIYDPAGNEVKAPTVFESASTYEISATTLQNGSVLMAYRDGGNSSFGTFAIYDPAGNEVKAPTVFESASTWEISATTLQNGSVLIAYRDSVNSSFGTFAIYDPAGNVVKAPTVFESASTWEISATTLQNGNVLIAYRDFGNSNFGTFAIWGSAGAEFTDRLAVTTDTEQAYDLFAINGSSSSSTINATQLGTGDIFNFANSGGEVLTLTNTGYLGLGTTSPLARLTVGSSTLDKLSVGELYRSQFIAGQLEVDGTAYFDSEIVVAGSATSTFEGPVTTGALTASSTITAPTYMTTGGVALGVGWTREGIWNNSIGALSGTYGLTTDQTNFRELTAPNVFESAVTEAISATTLQNGNVLIAYRDNGNSDFGTFAIYDPAGNVVKAPTVFASATTYDISATTLQNGNVLMAYSDTGNSNFGTFAIYDPAGNVVKAPTVFESAITSNISATTLQNGNVLIAYRDFGNNDFGTFAIYDPAGNVVKAPTVFASATAYDISATTLQNGNVLIAYRDFGNSDFGTFAIYDPAGNEVKTPTVFGSVFTWNISATTLQNGNVLIAYADNDNSNFGTFTIYDPAGNIVKAPTVFESAYATHISATTLQNGNVLIAYNGNSSFGTLVIYDPAGNEVKAPTVFEIGNTLNVSATTLQNGNVLIAYRDGGNSNFGTFAIWGSAGAEFTDRLAVTTETEQAYDLFAINGSSSSSTINATQLGTGDILTLDNATKRVLTVTNDGFLGLGAVSTRLFTVSGATNAGGRFIDETNSVTTEIRSEDNQGFIGTMSDHDLRFITNGSSRAALTNNGNFGLGTTSPMSKLSLQVDSFTGTGTAGFSNFITTTNSSEGAVQFGNYSYLTASNTATTTLVANLFRIQDDTDFDNTVRGLEVQTDRGINAGGENTALSGVARTFGVRGITRGNAGGSVEPAGGYFATEGTDSGNAIRGYSNSITTASLLALFQDSSDFEGTGLEMSFGNAGGTFSSSTSRYLDFQNNGSSVFTVSGSGTTTIGNGVAQAGLQIMNGGLCVDNGTGGGCTASTSGQISSISSYLGNSDLAETYFSRTDLLPGELISLVGGLSIDRANRADTLPVLGVVSTKPGLLLGADDSSLNEGERAYPVALTGRVPVKLSTESGPIKAGDQLMLSSLPGIAMKATGTGHIIGIALEDFDDTRKYSDTYLNQFGDDMVDPIFEPILTNNDPRINDGCYFGGGVDIGEAPCVPLTSITSMGRIDEANELAEQDSIEAQLEALREEESETVTLDDDTEVQVGQIVMFVEREDRLLDRPTLAALSVLMGTSTTVGEDEAETVFDRMVALANSFVDGVLSILELQVDRVEVKEELCVDGRCFSELEQRVLELEAQLQELSTQATVVETEPEPESTSEVEIPATEDSTTGVDGADLVVESVSGEEGVEIVPEIPAAETVETEALSDGQTTEDSTTVIVEEDVVVEGEVSRLSEPIESQEAESVPEEGVEEQSISDPVEVVSEPEPASAEVEVVADDGLFEGE